MKKTIYVKINPTEPLRFQLKEAAEIIKKGGLVAFPTETVYGLGANALDPVAVKSIFTAKNRPSDNPLIVHISKVVDLDVYAVKVSPLVRKLVAQFWPGPLTLVLKKSELIPLSVTAGSQTVTLRLPNHPIACELINLAGVPIAAPSANTSGRPSPTTAQHVLQDLDGKIDMVIDGGPTRVGVESTVLDAISEPPILLRPGEISFESLREYAPNIHLLSQLAVSETQRIRSPGLKYQHYSPSSKVVLIHAQTLKQFKAKAIELAQASIGKKIAVLSLDDLGETVTPYQVVAGTSSRYAALLFDAFRQFEQQGVDTIIAQAISEDGVGRAVMDRLTRAADEEVWI